MTERSGVVLAGGHSRRFGNTDKALVELCGKPLTVRVVNRLLAMTDDVAVSCRSEQVDALGEVLPNDIRIVTDRYPGAGPLAGIETGFDAVTGEYVAVVACDMPLVEPSVLKELFCRAKSNSADAIVPADTDGNLQPVQAVYKRNTMRTVAGEMLPEERSMHAALGVLSVVTVPVDTLSERSFHNVNTREDLDTIERTRDEPV